MTIYIFVNDEGHEDVVDFRNVVAYIINEELQSLKTKLSGLYKLLQKLYMIEF